MELSGNVPAIVVHDVKKIFRKRTGILHPKIKEEWALKGVSFSVRVGEIYGVLGPNGSGKSTLVRILSTLLIPDGGEIEILGHRLPAEESWIRQHIGRVSVDAAFYKKLSARENLLYAAQLYSLRTREVEQRAIDILEKLGLESRRFNDPLEEMSRGMQQKIAITRALLIDPPLLLLDEPTTGLDPRSRRDVQAFLETLRREQGTTILLTTHDIAEAERLCDRVSFLDAGVIVAEGTPEEMRQKAGSQTLEEAYLTLTGKKIEEGGAA